MKPKFWGKIIFKQKLTYGLKDGVKTFHTSKMSTISLLLRFSSMRPPPPPKKGKDQKEEEVGSREEDPTGRKEVGSREEDPAGRKVNQKNRQQAHRFNQKL